MGLLVRGWSPVWRTARAKPSWLPPSGLVKKERKPAARACTREELVRAHGTCTVHAWHVHGVCMARALGVVCLQCEPLRGGVVIDLDAERDSWREETKGWRGRCERRGQRGDGEQAASQLAPTKCEHHSRSMHVGGGGTARSTSECSFSTSYSRAARQRCLSVCLITPCKKQTD